MPQSVLQPDHFKGAQRPFPRLTCRTARQKQRQLNVLERVQYRQQVVALEHQPDPPGALISLLPVRQTAQTLPLQEHLASLKILQPGEAVQQRSLAAARRTDDGHDLAPFDAQPDIVTVWLAVNDLNARVSLDRYAADLDTLLARLEATHARVLVGNVPDLGSLAAYRGIDPGPLKAEVDRWNRVIADTTARHGDTLVDLYSTWQEVAQHPEFLSADGFHPSTEGYQALADVFGAVFDAQS